MSLHWPLALPWLEIQSALITTKKIECLGSFKARTGRLLNSFQAIWKAHLLRLYRQAIRKHKKNGPLVLTTNSPSVKTDAAERVL